MKLIEFDGVEFKIADEALLVRPIRELFEKDKSTGCSSFTTIINKTYHKNNQICDAFMNKTFCGEIRISECEPWKNTLEKVTRCMVNREWQE